MKITRERIHQFLAGSAAFGVCVYALWLWITTGESEYIFYSALLLVIGWTIVGVVK